MAKSPEIDHESFDRLLSWLDSDRDEAGKKYESIRNRLIHVLYGRGCHDAEALADETIDRVARKSGEFFDNYSGDPALFFYAVAKKIFLEYCRRPRTTELPPVLVRYEPDDADDIYQDCLSKCLTRLEPEQRRLIVGYFKGEKREKINRRKMIVQALGITNQTLRVRVLRIKLVLQNCVLACVEA